MYVGLLRSEIFKIGAHTPFFRDDRVEDVRGK